MYTALVPTMGISVDLRSSKAFALNHLPKGGLKKPYPPPLPLSHKDVVKQPHSGTAFDNFSVLKHNSYLLLWLNYKTNNIKISQRTYSPYTILKMEDSEIEASKELVEENNNNNNNPIAKWKTSINIPIKNYINKS